MRVRRIASILSILLFLLPFSIGNAAMVEGSLVYEEMTLQESDIACPFLFSHMPVNRNCETVVALDAGDVGKLKPREVFVRLSDMSFENTVTPLPANSLVTFSNQTPNNLTLLISRYQEDRRAGDVVERLEVKANKTVSWKAIEGEFLVRTKEFSHLQTSLLVLTHGPYSFVKDSTEFKFADIEAASYIVRFWTRCSGWQDGDAIFFYDKDEYSVKAIFSPEHKLTSFEKKRTKADYGEGEQNLDEMFVPNFVPPPPRRNREVPEPKQPVVPEPPKRKKPKPGMFKITPVKND